MRHADGRGLLALLATAAALALAGCGKESPRPEDPGSKVGEAARRMGEAARAGDVGQVGSAMKQMGEALTGAVKVEPVDFRQLRELLPGKLAGLPRVDAEGSRTNVMGIATSKAKAVYGNGKGARIQLEITDAGTLTGVASLAAAWINVEIDKEGDSGYERTTTVEGRRAYERYAKAGHKGELDVLVAGRFLVETKATGVDMKTFRDAVSKLDLAKLESLKTAGAPAPKK
jgi:hypothetical protein